MAQYKIEDQSIIDSNFGTEKKPYYALKSYEDSGEPIEKMLNREEARAILQDYSIVGKKSFIDAI